MHQLSRRSVLGQFAGGLASTRLPWTSALLAQEPAGKNPSATESAVDQKALLELKEQVAKILANHEIVGGSMAIAYRGQLVFNHAFGMADLAARRPTTVDTIFSLASVSKSVTGMAALLLIEREKLPLDAKVVDILKHLHPLPQEKIVDPRFHQITVHHLLFHGGGFIHDPPEVNQLPHNEAYDHQDSENRYRALMAKPLLCTPGTESHYSNAGFLVLRLAIEQVTGQDAEKFVRENILTPAGIRSMRVESGRNYFPNESHRYQAGNHQPADRILGNWMANAHELVRFASFVAGSGGKPSLLNQRTMSLMLTLPSTLRVQRPKGPHVGLGWDTVQTFPDGRFRFSKNGGKPGVQAWLEHRENDVELAVLLNTDNPERDKGSPKPIAEIRKLVAAMFPSNGGTNDE